MKRPAKWLLVCFGLLAVVATGIQPIRRAHNEHLKATVLADLKFLDAATDQWIISNGVTDRDLPTWDRIKPHLEPVRVAPRTGNVFEFCWDWMRERVKSDPRVLRNGGKDVFGRPYILGPGNEGFTTVDPITVAVLGWTHGLEKPWDKYYPTLPRASAFILAARQGNIPWMRELLTRGEDIDQLDPEGRTVLYRAAEVGQIEVARFICSVHADPVAAITAGSPSPLYQAIYRYPEIVALFLDRGVQLGSREIGMATQRTEILKLLLAHGMSPNLRDEIGRPILVCAAFQKNESARLLIEAGADVNAKGTRWGDTALQAAVKHQLTPEIPRLLIEAGADVNAKGEDDETPLHTAIRLERSDTEKVLRAAGAKE